MFALWTADYLGYLKRGSGKWLLAGKCIAANTCHQRDNAHLRNIRAVSSTIRVTTSCCKDPQSSIGDQMQPVVLYIMEYDTRVLLPLLVWILSTHKFEEQIVVAETSRTFFYVISLKSQEPSQNETGSRKRFWYPHQRQEYSTALSLISSLEMCPLKPSRWKVQLMSMPSTNAIEQVLSTVSLPQENSVLESSRWFSTVELC